jgi:DNA-binding HxlR family transcriptional regulator
MREACNFEFECPAESTMGIIGGRWKTMILCKLIRKGKFRFNQLMKDMDGISSRILSKQLKELEKDGLISRREVSGIHSHVEYSITEKGESLIPILMLMSHWGLKNVSSNMVQMSDCIRM